MQRKFEDIRVEHKGLGFDVGSTDGLKKLVLKTREGLDGGSRGGFEL